MVVVIIFFGDPEIKAEYNTHTHTQIQTRSMPRYGHTHTTYDRDNDMIRYTLDLFNTRHFDNLLLISEG